MGKSKVDQSNEVHHGKNDGAAWRMFPNELIQQQSDGADDNQDEGGDFDEIR